MKFNTTNCNYNNNKTTKEKKKNILNALVLRFLEGIMKKLTLTFIYIIMCTAIFAQKKEVQNRPYTDLRPLHLGVLVGAHTQDVELNNVGKQMIQIDETTQKEQLISVDQDSYDMGFQVGVLAEARINNHLAFRLAPSLYFGNRRIRFINYSEKTEDGAYFKELQDMKSVYVALPAELIVGTQRLNNTRPYIMAGLNPMLNLTSKETNILKFKPYDCYAEVGLGCDFYLPFFKLRPELKFMFSLIDALDKKHAEKLKDANMRKYSTAVSGAQTKMIALTFYFE